MPGAIGATRAWPCNNFIYLFYLFIYLFIGPFRGEEIIILVFLLAVFSLAGGNR